MTQLDSNPFLTRQGGGESQGLLKDLRASLKGKQSLPTALQTLYPSASLEGTAADVILPAACLTSIQHTHTFTLPAYTLFLH